MTKLKRPFRVKEEVVRGVALQVFILSLISVITLSIIPIIILLADFSIRVILVPKLSPLVLLSNTIISKIFRKRIILFKPKRFAAGIGMLMSAAALVLLILNYNFVTIIVMLVLALFSFLETFFKFCAGCKIFGLLIKCGVFEEDECLDCVYQDGSGI